MAADGSSETTEARARVAMSISSVLTESLTRKKQGCPLGISAREVSLHSGAPGTCYGRRTLEETPGEQIAGEPGVSGMERKQQNSKCLGKNHGLFSPL